MPRHRSSNTDRRRLSIVMVVAYGSSQGDVGYVPKVSDFLDLPAE